MAVKDKVARGGFKLSRRRVKRSPVGTAALYGKALVGDAEAREELRSAIASARKARARGSDKDVGKAAASLSRALRIAERKREKPRSAKGPAIAIAAAAGAGAAVAAKRSHSANGDTSQPVVMKP